MKCKSCNLEFEQSDLRMTCGMCRTEMCFNPIFLDLETSGLLDTDPQIYEIYAYNNGNIFHKYCIPYQKNFGYEVNKLIVKDDKLYYKDQEITNIDTEENVLKEFINWLGKDRVEILAYYIQFDKTVLLRQMKKYNLNFELPIRWYCVWLKTKRLNNKSMKFYMALQHYNIEFESDNLHGAKYDVECLIKLYYKIEKRVDVYIDTEYIDSIKMPIHFMYRLKDLLSKKLYNYFENIPESVKIIKITKEKGSNIKDVMFNKKGICLLNVEFQTILDKNSIKIIVDNTNDLEEFLNKTEETWKTNAFLEMLEKWSS